MTDRAGFEQFLEEFTGRNIEWHTSGGTWGIDESSFAYAIWKKYSIAADALKYVRERLTDHPAYAELSEDEEIEEGGDTAEFSYLVRTINEALKCTQ